MSATPRRGDIWATDHIDVLVISSTVYNEIPTEPTVVVIPVFVSEPDTGFGVNLGDGWAAPDWSPACVRTASRSGADRSACKP